LYSISTNQTECPLNDIKEVFGWGKNGFPKKSFSMENHFPKKIEFHVELNNFNGEKYPPNDHIRDRY